MPTLYVCATPIGNLSDVSPNLLETLRTVDLIAAEDTRRIQKILNKFSIKTRTQSFHKFNARQKISAMIAFLKGGKNIALVTDGGTPGIADPGAELVAASRREKIKVKVVAGPCAAVAALSISGSNADRFCFEGFLPAKEAALRQRLQRLRFEDRPIVLYEAPHRLLKTLRAIQAVFGKVWVFVARELTKTFEESIFGTAEEVLAHFATHLPRGEFVIVIDAVVRREKEFSPSSIAGGKELCDLAALIAEMQKQNLSKKQISKIVARGFSLSAKEVYKRLLEC
jgi:16S rRNA (cytidine1402-2'-O)-methyltransferase